MNNDQAQLGNARHLLQAVRADISVATQELVNVRRETDEAKGKLDDIIAVTAKERVNLEASRSLNRELNKEIEAEKRALAEEEVRINKVAEDARRDIVAREKSLDVKEAKANSEIRALRSEGKSLREELKVFEANIQKSRETLDHLEKQEIAQREVNKEIFADRDKALREMEHAQHILSEANETLKSVQHEVQVLKLTAEDHTLRGKNLLLKEKNIKVIENRLRKKYSIQI